MIKWKGMRWARQVALVGEKRIAFRILERKSEGMRPLLRLRSKCVYNVKMDLREIGWNGVD
jgi:hypothetical protein